MAEQPSEWLASTLEEVLEPELPICDPHHHLWDHPDSRYLLDEVLLDTSPSTSSGQAPSAGSGQAPSTGHNVRSTVFVECASMYRAAGPPELRPVGETEFVQGIAAMSASGGYAETRIAAGIVSFADLALGARAAEVLEAHVAASPNRFKGIRHASGWHESPDIRNSHTNPPQGLLLDSTFREGFQKLAEYGLSFDAWLYHPQLHELADLAKAYPATIIILDHMGGPLGVGPYEGEREAVFAEWRKSIALAAQCPNVVVKLGGVNMPINGFGWHRREAPPTSTELLEATREYYLTCLELFGVERCMFESNFPVDKRSCSYAVLWNTFKRLTEDFAASERAALFHDNAVRIYRL
ncbi:MAG: amidohydrolase family protein [Pseudomonadales bacterium]